MTVNWGLRVGAWGLAALSMQFACEPQESVEGTRGVVRPDASVLVNSDTPQDESDGRLVDAGQLLKGETGETESAPDASPGTGPTLLCGVGVTAQVEAVLCPKEVAGCQYEVGCCVEAGFEAELQDCEQLRQTNCTNKIMSNLQAGACFDLAAHQRNLVTPDCDKDILSLRNDCLFPLFQRIQTLLARACQPVWLKGNLPPGSTCSDSAQCAVSGEKVGSVCPVVNSEGPTSECRSFTILEAEDSCDLPTPGSCPFGTVCRGERGERRCSPLLALGEACNGSNVCTSQACYDGVCTDPLEISSSPCLGGSCPLGFTCQSDQCVRLLLHEGRGGCDFTP